MEVAIIGIAKMIDISDKKQCCGCTACASICPKNCIEMKEDTEGFLYPCVDKSKCVECGACKRVCPIANSKKEIPFEQAAYIVQNRNDKVLRESTAGGAFTSIARYTIEHKGVVFGVELGKDLVVRHAYVEKECDLVRFRNSKYVQSSIGKTYKQVKSFLEEGKLVCFSGTPCQIEGLKNYLKIDYENLITVDVVCRAVPSPMIFRKYVEYQEKRMAASIDIVRFRDKHYGYKYSTLNIITGRNDGNYHQGIESDPWLRAFFSNICDRPSCYDCHFKKRFRVSDFTIWDCFNVGRFSKELDNDKGATRVLIHTEKGRRIFDEIKTDFFFAQTTPEAIVASTEQIRKSVVPNKQRQEFFDDANKLDGTQLFQKYFPYSFRVKGEHSIRLICYRLGIYSAAKKMYMRIKRKY